MSRSFTSLRLLGQDAVPLRSKFMWDLGHKQDSMAGSEPVVLPPEQEERVQTEQTSRQEDERQCITGLRAQIPELTIYPALPFLAV